MEDLFNERKIIESSAYMKVFVDTDFSSLEAVLKESFRRRLGAILIE